MLYCVLNRLGCIAYQLDIKIVISCLASTCNKRCFEIVSLKCISVTSRSVRKNPSPSASKSKNIGLSTQHVFGAPVVNSPDFDIRDTSIDVRLYMPYQDSICIVCRPSFGFNINCTNFFEVFTDRVASEREFPRPYGQQYCFQSFFGSHCRYSHCQNFPLVIWLGESVLTR